MLCHKNVIVSVIVTVTIALFIFTEAELYNSLKWTPVPWLGVVTLSGIYENASIGLIPVIMIADGRGIADARGMASIHKYNWEKVKNYTHVMFLTTKAEAWYAKVEKIILHPEYNEDTLTTLALLNLEYDLKSFKANMLRWPFKFSNVSTTNKEIFAIGYTNRSHVFEQIIYRMDHVRLSECQAFYFLEELDTKWMRPKQYHCYKVRFSKETCVFKPGMALVQYADGKYSLMGLSVWGPGCSLPARFMDFERFVPWIISYMKTRRNARPLDPEMVGVYPDKTRDKWMLERITDQSLALRPLKIKERKDLEEETVHGLCEKEEDNMRRDQLIYNEVTEFTTRRGPNRRRIRALAVYALSLYNREYNTSFYTCIQVKAKCSKKSDSVLEYSKGFQEGDQFEPFVKTIIDPSTWKDVYPPYVHKIKDSWQNYEYDIIGTDITHLIFRFEFEVRALIEVTFFGNRTDAYGPLVESTTKMNYTVIYSTTRWQRPYYTKNLPTAPQYNKSNWMWFIDYLHTAESQTFPSTTVTTKKTKRMKIKHTRSPGMTPYWWNKWWHFQTEPAPMLDKNWWKG